MDEKIIIVSSERSNILKAITDYLESEVIDYSVEGNLSHIDKYTKTIIFIDNGNGETFTEYSNNKNLSIIVISAKKRILDLKETTVNYIITNLVSDNTAYTDVQKEYLFKKGIYHFFLERLAELIENKGEYNGMIFDLTELKSIPNNWVFSFSSINDTYSWLSKKNKMLPDNFVRKVINFYDDKVYDDSLREINYLTEKLMEIKDGKNVIDVFICNKEELSFFKKNYFFKLLIKNISPTYRFYLIDKERLVENDSDLMSKLKDGIAIYNDCVYRDTYDDEISLGFVDCNTCVINEYNEYFDYIVKKYGVEIKKESDLDEF